MKKIFQVLCSILALVYFMSEYGTGRRALASVAVVGVAGTGIAGNSNGNGNAIGAQLRNPTGLAFDPAGNLYVADTGNHLIRKISSAGQILTIVGAGVAGYSGDWGAASASRLNAPTGVIVDRDGSIFIADTGNHSIRKVLKDGTIYTYTGNGSQGMAGDGLPLAYGVFNSPTSLAIRSDGDLFIADTGNNVIRRASKSGNLARMAGSGVAGVSPDGTVALDAKLSAPRGLFFDASDNLYFSDSGNNRICKITPDGILHVVAGISHGGYAGDGGMAYSAALSTPAQGAMDTYGNIFFNDNTNHVVRKISRSGVITTLAGNGADASVTKTGTDAGPASAAEFSYPIGLAVSPRGGIYISDSADHIIRKIVPAEIALNRAKPSAGISETFISADFIESYSYSVPADAAGVDKMIVTEIISVPSGGAAVLGEGVDISLVSGSKVFNKTASFTFRFNRALLDQSLAGKNRDLVRMAYLDGNTWKVLGEYKLVGNEITLQTNRAGKYAITHEGPAAGFSNVLVYPNPVNFSRNKNLRFDFLTDTSVIRVYDLNGGLVQTIRAENIAGKAEWDGRNQEGSLVAPGTYVYILEDDTSHKRTGKIGVIE